MSEAPATLFEAIRPRLLAICCRILASRAEAEDVVQETWLKWHRADHAALQTPAAWLTTVARHLAIDRLRQAARELALAEAASAGAETHSPSPEEWLASRSELARAFELLHQRLSAAERVALVLHEAFDCEHAEIAAELGTTPSNSRQIVHRARRRILREPLREPSREPLRERQREPAPAPVGEELSRALVQDFLAAMQELDRQAVLTLVGDRAIQAQLGAMQAEFLQIRAQIQKLTLGKLILAIAA